MNGRAKRAPSAGFGAVACAHAGIDDAGFHQGAVLTALEVMGRLGVISMVEGAAQGSRRKSDGLGRGVYVFS